MIVIIAIDVNRRGMMAVVSHPAPQSFNFSNTAPKKRIIHKRSKAIHDIYSESNVSHQVNQPQQANQVVVHLDSDPQIKPAPGDI